MKSSLRIPKSYKELTTILDKLDDSEKSEMAIRLADNIIANDLFGDSEDAWIIRQVLKYIPTIKRGAYVGNIFSNTSSTENKYNIDTWLGNPFDNEGAVFLMESTFNEKGWEWIISTNNPFSLTQRVRILERIQTSDAEAIWTKIILDEKLTKRTHEVPYIYTKSAVDKWLTPDTWPGLKSLKIENKYSLWCMYAKLNNIDILTKLANALDWKIWTQEQIFRPNTDHYAFKYVDRLTYIKTLITNSKALDKKQDAEIELPELEISLF